MYSQRERYDEVEIHTPARCPGGNNASRCARQWDLRNLVSALNPPFLRPRCISRFKTHVIYSHTGSASGGHNVARNVFTIQTNNVANTKCARKTCVSVLEELFFYRHEDHYRIEHSIFRLLYIRKWKCTIVLSRRLEESISRSILCVHLIMMLT